MHSREVVLFSKEGECVQELGERTLSIQGIEIKGGCFQDGSHPYDKSWEDPDGLEKRKTPESHW